MITLNQFYKAFEQIAYLPDQRQQHAIETPIDKPLFLVAGPGTGRTACLAIRILKLIFVDSLEPETILALAETSEAALKLRSQIIRRGLQLSAIIQKDRKIALSRRKLAANLNISLIVTGTPDSLCIHLFRHYYNSGASYDTRSYFHIDKYTSLTMLFKKGLLEEKRYNDKELKRFLAEIIPVDEKARHSDGTMNHILQSVWKRRIQDQTDWQKFMRTGPRKQQDARQRLNDILDDYQNALAEHRFIDVDLLKQEILEQLRVKRLQAFQNQIQAVLIDQYQETNLLHEALYFELARASHGAITVAGDDDQSLLRYLGATVELFIDFPSRCRAVLKKSPRRVYLKTDYCATRPIIRFINAYIRSDGAYQQIRYQPKPKIIPPSGVSSDNSDALPVLGMFRDDPHTLAHSLSSFISQIFIEKGFMLPNGTRIQRTPRIGDVGDCCLLGQDPYEGRRPKMRMLGLLRKELEKINIKMFNPWAVDLNTTMYMRLFGGLILKCLDRSPKVKITSGKLHPYALVTFQNWRRTATAYLRRSASRQLQRFVQQWGKRLSSSVDGKWPPSLSVYELVYGLVHFLPKMTDDPQGRICFKIIIRQLAACIRLRRFNDHTPNEPAMTGISSEELLTDFLGPIACGAVAMDEALIDRLPRDHLNVLPICYARKSVAPLIIADVGSDFINEQDDHASKRFPTQGGLTHAIEDLLRYMHPQLETLKRSGKDRAFDDLYRGFFTAFSRARDVLLLVGLNQTHPNPQKSSETKIRNVATGWRRDEICEWKKKTPFVDI